MARQVRPIPIPTCPDADGNHSSESTSRDSNTALRPSPAHRALGERRAVRRPHVYGHSALLWFFLRPHHAAPPHADDSPLERTRAANSDHRVAARAVGTTDAS